jgi:hypothetical protein
MEKRTIADCVAGIDELLCALDPQPQNLDLVRIALADCLHRHRVISDHLEAGCDPLWLITDGVIPFWPQDAQLNDLGIPRHGVELYPIAAAVLAVAEQPQDLLSTSVTILAALAPLRAADDLAALVAAEFLEVLLFADLATRP